MIKTLIIRLLEQRARQLLTKFKPKIVAVTGSVGKTSTKIAIATVLSQKYKVLAHYSNYNTPISLPLAMFNLRLPNNLKSPLAWLKIWLAMGKQLRGNYPYQVLVLELGTDKPGDVEYFKKYLHPDIAVVTAVAPEHMEFFGTLDAVAKEELSVAQFADLTLINRDDINSEYAKYIPDGTNLSTYGTSGVAEYHFLTDNFEPDKGFEGAFVAPDWQQKATLKLAGEHNIRAAVAAGAVGVKMGLTPQQVVDGLQNIRPVNGRMNLLKGLRGTTIIDDTYNASPLAGVAAMQALYTFPARQRIAILGSMNELGEFSKQAHEQVGQTCDPSMIDWVITIGEDAKKYLAPAAELRGCRVRSFDNPYQAGGEANKLMEPGAVILAKGSQNGVFAEEAVKVLLHDNQDEAQLVRQTPDWMAKKEAQFDKFADPTKK